MGRSRSAKLPRKTIWKKRAKSFHFPQVTPGGGTFKKAAGGCEFDFRVPSPHSHTEHCCFRWLEVHRSCGKDHELSAEGMPAFKPFLRSKKTGVHSNDAESEFGRFKLWHRLKYSRMRTLNTKDQAAKKTHMDGHVAEYVLQTNAGEKMRLNMKLLLEAFVGLAGVRRFSRVCFSF